MTDTILKLMSVVIGMAFGIAVVLHIFWQPLRHTYHYMFVLFQFRSHPSNRLAIWLITTLGCWGIIGFALLTLIFTAAQFGHLSYWYIPIGFFGWLNIAVLLAVMCVKLMKVPEPETPAEKATDLELWHQMSDALRLRLGKPIKRRSTIQKSS